MKTKVNITVDEELLRKIDEYADDNYTSRSGVFSQGAAALVNQGILLRAAQDMAVSFRRIADSGKLDENTVNELEQITAAMSLLAGKK